MAQGDVVFFNQFLEDEADKLHNLSTDDLYLGLITSAATPAATSSDPRWGTGGSTNFSTNEVSGTGGNYPADGVNMSVTITDGISRTGGTVDLLADNVSIAQHASNPTDARWGIIYNYTAAGKQCVGFVDLGADSDLTSGPFSITWSGTNVISAKTQA
jgi:hypothetical protein